MPNIIKIRAKSEAKLAPNWLLCTPLLVFLSIWKTPSYTSGQDCLTSHRAFKRHHSIYWGNELESLAQIWNQKDENRTHRNRHHVGSPPLLKKKLMSSSDSSTPEHPTASIANYHSLLHCPLPRSWLYLTAIRRLEALVMGGEGLWEAPMCCWRPYWHRECVSGSFIWRVEIIGIRDGLRWDVCFTRRLRTSSKTVCHCSPTLSWQKYFMHTSTRTLQPSHPPTQTLTDPALPHPSGHVWDLRVIVLYIPILSMVQDT